MRTEHDIRVAFRDLASQAPDTATVRAAVLADGQPRLAQPTPRGGTHRGWARLAAPVAAAAAVTGLAISAVAFTGPGRTAEAGWRTRLMASVPRYYITLLPDRTHRTNYAAIRSTFTGATVATVRPPGPFGFFDDVTAAADDRSFVLAATTDGKYPPAITKFFLARFSPATGRIKLTSCEFPQSIPILAS